MHVGFEVPPLSVKDIAKKALEFRSVTGTMDVNKFPVEKVLEYKLPDFGVTFAPLSHEEMGNKEGLTYPDKMEIFLREDVYEGMCDGKGRDRFTGCHEIGHLALHGGIGLARDVAGQSIPKYKDSEWQANTFASLLLMPTHLVGNYLDDAYALADAFGVSVQAAEVRIGLRERHKV